MRGLPTVAPTAPCDVAIVQNALATRTSILRIPISASIPSFDRKLRDRFHIVGANNRDRQESRIEEIGQAFFFGPRRTGPYCYDGNEKWLA